MTTKNLKTWIEIDPNSDFTIHNIPFGIYSDNKVEHHACSAIGDYIIDLRFAKTYKQMKYSLLINNLFNRQYMTRPCDIRPPRSIMLQVNWKI